MTDKPVMTKGELEKLGYIVTNQHQVISPDGWEFMTGGDALQAATKHHQQQQELARLRETFLEIYDVVKHGTDGDGTPGSWYDIGEYVEKRFRSEWLDLLPTISEGEAK